MMGTYAKKSGFKDDSDWNMRKCIDAYRHRMFKLLKAGLISLERYEDGMRRAREVEQL